MRRRPTAHRTIRILAATTLCTAMCASASAAQSVTLRATLTPEHLGHSTTIGFSFTITTPMHEVPPPLTSAEISYPVELAFALSELGLATCSPGTLEIFGPKGCPANSLMGDGTAFAEIPIGPSIAREHAQVRIIRATNQAGHIALLIDVNAPTPVSEQITFPGLLLPATTPYGGLLDMHIPLIAGLPEGPDVSIVQFRSTLGPLHLHYRQHIHGRTVEYEPKGVRLPPKCPSGGFQFLARFAFQNGSHSQAAATVPCPHQTRYTVNRTLPTPPAAARVPGPSDYRWMCLVWAHTQSETTTDG